MTNNPTNPQGGRLRRFWWQRVRRYAYEICQDCGRPVGVVWTAPDELWLAMMGRKDGDVLCIPCFDARCEAEIRYLRWVPRPL